MSTTAYSTKTDTEYLSWDNLVAAEANGYVVVIIMRDAGFKSGKTTTFARVVGPLPDRKSARARAAAVRRRWKCALKDRPGTELVGIRVEPLWKELQP